MQYRIIDSAVPGRKGIWIKDFSQQVVNELTGMITDPEWNDLTHMLFFGAEDLGKVEAYLQQQTEPSAQLWAVIELFGHQIIAGAVSKVEPFGSPMVQVDVPATDRQPAFTRQFGPSAIYGITYVSEGVARATAREVNHKPVKIYVPELADIETLVKENKALRSQLAQRQLDDSLNNEDWGYDGDHG